MKAKKAISLILALVMALGCMSLPAFAATYVDKASFNVLVDDNADDEIAYFIYNGNNSVSVSDVALEDNKVPTSLQFKDAVEGENKNYQYFKSTDSSSDNRLVVKKGYTITNKYSSGYQYLKSGTTSYLSSNSKVQDDFSPLTIVVTPSVEVSVVSYPEGAPAASIYYRGLSGTVMNIPKSKNLNLYNNTWNMTDPYITATNNTTYTFDGWYPDNGEGEPIGAKITNSSISMKSDMKFVAVFKSAEKYTVNLAAGEHGTVTANSIQVNKAAPYNVITSNTLSGYATPEAGYQLTGWYLDDTVAVDGTHTYTPTGDMTLTAVFEEIPKPDPEPIVVEPTKYTVTFDSAGGRPVASQTVEENDTATAPTVTRLGYDFNGWYIGEDPFDFSTPVTANLTLTAKWTKDESAFLTSDDKFRVKGQLDLFGADATVKNDFSATLQVHRGYAGLYEAGDKTLTFGMNGVTSLGIDADQSRINAIRVGNVDASAIANGISQDLYSALFNAIDGVLGKIGGDKLTINAGGKTGTYSFTKTPSPLTGDVITLTATPGGDLGGVWSYLANSDTIASTTGDEAYGFTVAGGSSFQIGDEMRTIPNTVTAPLKDHTGEFDFTEFRKAFYEPNISDIETVTENTKKVILTLKAGTALQLGESRAELLRDVTFTVSGLNLKSGMVTTLAGNTGAQTLDLISTWTPILDNSAVTIDIDVSEESAEHFVGDNKLRIAGKLDLFGADLIIDPSFNGSLTLYKGSDGFGGSDPTIRIVANGLDKIGSLDKTIDVGNVSIESLQEMAKGTQINPDTITYDWLYNALLSPLATNIAKQDIKVVYSEKQSTFTLSRSTTSDSVTVTFTGDEVDFGDEWNALFGSGASYPVQMSYAADEAEALSFTLVKGSYIRVGNQTRTLTQSLNNISLLDNRGEVDLAPAKDALMGGIESTVTSDTNDGKIVIELQAGTSVTVGQTTITLNQPIRVTAKGFGVEDNMISTITHITAGGSDVKLTDISGLLSLIPDKENNKLTFTFEVVELAPVAKIDKTEYTSLQAAIDAATAGQTIELLDSFTLRESVTVPAGKTVTLDYNGYTITSTLNDVLAPIENKGTLTVIDTSKDKTGGIAGVNRCINNYGTLNVGTGDFDATTKTTSNKVFGGNYRTTRRDIGTAIQNKSETGVVNIFDCVVNAGRFAYYNSGITTVYGGTFNGDSCVTCDGEFAYTFSSEGTLTIYDATVTGVHGALGAVGGTAKVYGGSYSAVACERLVNNHGNKSATSGTFYAFYVAGENANVSAEVYGGNFSSEGYSVVLNGNSGDGGLKQNASLKIFGGTFEAKSSHTTVFNNDKVLGDPLISGGIFKAQNAEKIEAFKSSVTDKQYLAEGCELKKLDDLSYEVVETKTYVAENGETQYETLQEAFDAAANGQTVKLLSDITLTKCVSVNGTMEAPLSKSVTLDMNGKNIDGTGRLTLRGGSLNITGNGKISTTASGVAPVDIYYTGDPTAKRALTIGEGVTLDGSASGYGLNIFGTNNATYANSIDVTINGTVKSVVFVLGNLTNDSNAINITVNNGAKIESNGTGIALNGYANLTVNDGAEIKGTTAVEVRAGNLTVNGGKFTASGTTYTVEANPSGTTSTGVALAVSQHTTAKKINVKIKGGTFTGPCALGIANPQANKDTNVTVSVTGGKFEGEIVQSVVNADNRVTGFITDGLFKHDPTKSDTIINVATGYEAVQLSSGDNKDWYQVGKVQAKNLSEEENPNDGFAKTYTASKKVVDTTDETSTLKSDTAITVNVKGTTAAESTSQVADAALNQIKETELENVVAAAVEAADTNETTINIQIEVVRDEGSEDATAKKVTYEVHPEAIAYVTTDNETSKVGSVEIENAQLAENATFSITLPVPAELVSTDNKIAVTHKHSNGDEEYLGKKDVTGNATDGYYVTITGITSFSEFELQSIDSIPVGNADAGFTISLADSIDLNMYIYNLAENTVEEDYRLSVNGVDHELGVLGTNNNKYKIVVAHCSAKEVANEYTIQLKYHGEAIKTVTYSIKQYCENMCKLSTASEKLKTLCKSVLDYGAMAQTYFGYNVNSPANVNYSQWDSVADTAVPGDMNVKDHGGNTNLFAGAGMTLSLESKTEINFYFTPASGHSIGDYRFDVEINGVKVKTGVEGSTLTQNGTRYNLKVDGIAASCLNQTVIVTGYLANDTTDTVWVRYSPLSYAYSMESYPSQVDLINVCRALYQYYLAAANFFNLSN